MMEGIQGEALEGYLELKSSDLVTTSYQARAPFMHATPFSRFLLQDCVRHEALARSQDDPISPAVSDHERNVSFQSCIATTRHYNYNRKANRIYCIIYLHSRGGKQFTSAPHSTQPCKHILIVPSNFMSRCTPPLRYSDVISHELNCGAYGCALQRVV